MSATVSTPSRHRVTPRVAHLRSLVRRVRQSDPHAGVILAAVEGAWAGGPPLEVDGTAWRVVEAPSVLALHAALVEHAERGDEDRVLVLTPLSEPDVGMDVLVRVARRRIHTLEPWVLLRDAFRAQTVDPRVARLGWLSEYLLDHAPIDGFPPAVSGTLDLDTAWRQAFELALGVPDHSPDARTLLRWSVQPAAANRWAAVPGDVQEGIAERLQSIGGPLGQALGATIRAGRATQLVSLGLVLDVLWPLHGVATLHLPEVVAARVRLEPMLGGTVPPDEIARRWADAALKIFDELPAADAMRLAQEATRLLADLRADALVHASDRLPGALLRRGQRLAQALTAALADSAPLEDVRTALEQFTAHRAVAVEPERTARAQMAARVVGALRAGAGHPEGGFGEAVHRYVGEGSWLDAGRIALLAGDPIAELAACYRELWRAARERREAESQAFATQFVAWNQQPGRLPGMLPLEDVLERAVAPIAQARPVLVLLLDGLDLAIARRLLDDARGRGWSVWQPGSAPLVGISTLPSVTAAARATLFAGRVCRGSQRTEKDDFARHAALRRATAGRELPLLFHKADLGTGNALGEEMRVAIRDPRRPVVGAVINAIDDWLDRSDQTLPRWSITAIPLLDALLEEAAAAGRAVLVLSDHGHVLDAETTSPTSAESARWRLASSTAAGEVRATGPRVQAASGESSIVVAWSETLRYTGKRTGYHGGASPQEVIVPVVVMTRDELGVEGWQVAPDQPPAWWHLGAEAATVATSTAAPTAVEPGAATTPPSAGSGPAWLDALLRSGRYAEQRSAAGRMAPRDEHVVALLRLLDASGGRAPLSALGPVLGVAAVRVPGVLAGIRRVLNVEGYSVLDQDASDVVMLNRQLLATQFGIGEG